jgi:hypothetical protein
MERMMFRYGRVRLTGIALALAVSAIACSGSSSPSAPSIPTFVNVAGLWTGRVTITSISGGECVGVTEQALGAVGSSQTYTLQVTQAGSSLTAVATSNATGISTNFSGTAGTASIALNATSSTAALVFGIHCSNGQLRDTQLSVETIDATVSGNTGSGTSAETANVYIAGTQTGVGILITNASFAMNR